MKKTAKETFPQIEERVLSFWKDKDIFAKSLELRKDSPRFSFFDGPPFATGLPHYGHILAMAIKDVVTRYKTMKGFYVPRKNGWDCHGLPVEYELEKELGIKSKADIEKLGVDVFNSKARNIVMRYSDEWKKTIERMGRWIDTEHAYKTMNNDYIESVWWVFKQIWDKGYVYKDFRVSPYCPRCGTTLANFEVTQGYKNVKDESVFVKFKIKDQDNSYFLVWTTTPWTLPSNVALAAGEDIEYVKVRIKNCELRIADEGARSDGSDPSQAQDDKKCARDEVFYVLAKDRLSVLDGEYEVIEEYKGADVAGMEYEPLYKTTPKDYQYKVYTADFVSTEDGSGIVHIAPAFGEDDMRVGKDNGLPTVIMVDLEGKILKDKSLPGEGKFVKEADKDIKADLESRGLLYKAEKIMHDYPFCWRCDTPLLYYALPSWYVNVRAVQDKLIENNEQIHWVPNHLKYGRFGKWLEGVKDWAISRSRYWGAPIPVWQCEKCGESRAVGSREELDISDKFDLHKPQIDEIELDCKCGGKMKRTPEVFDCWFESGSMPYAEWHYPFENEAEFRAGFPADFIAEGLDQTRGWFYTLHVLATMIENKPAFKNVVVNGLVLANDGKKLSKSLRNYTAPEEIFDSVGVDALRYFLMVSTPIGEDYRFSDDAVREQVRKFILPLWNSYNYLETYAGVENWQVGETSELTALDRWMLAKLNQATHDINKWMDRYELTRAARILTDLVGDMSTWYIRRSRKRKDKAFFATLYKTIKAMAKLSAPFTPFIAEELFQNMREENDPESVHLCDYPKAGEIDKEILREMDEVRALVEAGHALRAENGLKVRQPLGALSINLEKEKISDELIEILLDELNVKKFEPDFSEFKNKTSVKVGEIKGLEVAIDTEITPELAQEGMYREIVRHIQDLRKMAGYKAGEMAKVAMQGPENIALMLEKKATDLAEDTSTEIVKTVPDKIDGQKSIKVDGETVELMISK